MRLRKVRGQKGKEQDEMHFNEWVRVSNPELILCEFCCEALGEGIRN
jgi:hypothetical protein